MKNRKTLLDRKASQLSAMVTDWAKREAILVPGERIVLTLKLEHGPLCLPRSIVPSYEGFSVSLKKGKRAFWRHLEDKEWSEIVTLFNNKPAMMCFFELLRSVGNRPLTEKQITKAAGEASVPYEYGSQPRANLEFTKRKLPYYLGKIKIAKWLCKDDKWAIFVRSS